MQHHKALFAKQAQKNAAAAVKQKPILLHTWVQAKTCQGPQGATQLSVGEAAAAHSQFGVAGTQPARIRTKAGSAERP
eukprot:1083373-Pelagomonas_calceolata.AAC.4